MSIFPLFSIILTLWRATACWNKSSLSHNTAVHLSILPPKRRVTFFHTYIPPQFIPTIRATPSADNHIPLTRTMSEAISFASFTRLTTQDAKIDQEQSPPPQSTSSNHPDDSEPQSTISEASRGNPPRTVRELAAWFDAKTNGNMRLEVLNWDGRVVDVPKNILQKALVE
jgi:hypothetical protein